MMNDKEFVSKLSFYNGMKKFPTGNSKFAQEIGKIQERSYLGQIHLTNVTQINYAFLLFGTTEGNK